MNLPALPNPDLQAQQQLVQEDLLKIHAGRNDPAMLALRRQLELRLQSSERKLRSCGRDEFEKLQGACSTLDDVLNLMQQRPMF